MMQTTPAEQRRAHRKRVGTSQEVTDVITCRPIGRLGDLSRGGLMLITPHAPGNGAIYQLRMELSARDMASRTIEVGVQALWHKRVTSSDQVWAGYRIIAISDADADFLDTWLA